MDNKNNDETEKLLDVARTLLSLANQREKPEIVKKISRPDNSKQVSESSRSDNSKQVDESSRSDNSKQAEESSCLDNSKQANNSYSSYKQVDESTITSIYKVEDQSEKLNDNKTMTSIMEAMFPQWKGVPFTEMLIKIKNETGYIITEILENKNTRANVEHNYFKIQNSIKKINIVFCINNNDIFISKEGWKSRYYGFRRIFEALREVKPDDKNNQKIFIAESAEGPTQVVPCKHTNEHTLTVHNPSNTILNFKYGIQAKITHIITFNYDTDVNSCLPALVSHYNHVKIFHKDIWGKIKDSVYLKAAFDLNTRTVATANSNGGCASAASRVMPSNSIDGLAGASNSASVSRVMSSNSNGSYAGAGASAGASTSRVMPSNSNGGDASAKKTNSFSVDSIIYKSYNKKDKIKEKFTYKKGDKVIIENPNKNLNFLNNEKGVIMNILIYDNKVHRKVFILVDNQNALKRIKYVNTGKPLDDTNNILWAGVNLNQIKLITSEDSNAKDSNDKTKADESVEANNSESDSDYEAQQDKLVIDEGSDCESQSEVAAERLKAERLEAERLKAERLEAERLKAERLEAERLEAERLKAERLEAERLKTERLKAERLEAERLKAERLEAERLEAERLKAEKLEAANKLANIGKKRKNANDDDDVIIVSVTNNNGGSASNKHSKSDNSSGSSSGSGTGSSEDPISID